MNAPRPAVRVAVVGKYVQMPDAYMSVIEALRHAAVHHGVEVQLLGNAEDLEGDVVSALDGIDGIVVPGGFGHRGIEGKLAASRHARHQQVPYLGLCLGMQCAVIDFAREASTPRTRTPPSSTPSPPPGHRPPPRAARHRGQGRDDAPRRLSLPAGARIEGCGGVRRGGGVRASPPPLRVQQPLPRAAGARGDDGQRGVAERPARRGRRAPRPPVLRRLAVPPRVPLPAERAPSALPRLRRRRLRARRGPLQPADPDAAPAPRLPV